MNTDQNNNPVHQSGLSSRPEQLSQDTYPQRKEPLQDAEPFGPVIFSYTRRQALADGVQIDVTETAREAGFRFSVFLTRSVFDAYVAVPEGVEGQDEAGRLWDILWMLRNTMRRMGDNGDQRIPFRMHIGDKLTSKPRGIVFQLYVRNNNKRARLATLTAECGPRDFYDPTPAITITLLDEK